MTPQDTDIRHRLQQLETLLQDLESVTDRTLQDKARQVVQTVLEFHGAALTRLLELIAQTGETGQAMIDDMGADELVGSLLLLHGLHPLDLESRVRQALDSVRPYLASHSGQVELLELTPDGTVRLRLEGSCHGCSSSQATLKNTIEEAIFAAAPEIGEIQVEGLAEEHPPPANGHSGFVPVSQLTMHRRPSRAAAGA